MSLQVWLPLNKDPNMTPEIASYRKESGITLTEDTDGWYKIQDSTHTSGRWGIYYDFNVRPNTTYTLYVYSKSTTGATASIAIQSFPSVATWPAVRETNKSSTEKLTTYSWTTDSSDKSARVYLALMTSTTKENDYIFYKEPRVYETPQNQGLTNIEITNKNAIYNNIGKIGGSYYFNGIDSRIACSELTCPYPISICGWFKPTDITNTNTQYWLSYNTATGGTAGHAIAIGTYSGKFAIWRGGSVVNGFTQVLLNDIWYHIVVVIKSDKTYQVYLNGEQIYSATCGNHPGSTWFTIGARSNSSTGGTGGAAYYYKGYMNDIRLYNHALTEREIKELARGLVLHYPLDNNGHGNANIFNANNWQQNDTTAINIINDYSMTVAQTSYIENKNQYVLPSNHGDLTISFDCETLSINGATAGVYLKDNTGKSIRISLTSVGYIQHLSLHIDPSATHILFSSWGYSGQIKLTNIKLEKGIVETHFSPREETGIVYDISGFNNNGQYYSYDSYGSITYITDSPRYNTCIHLDNDAKNASSNVKSGTKYIYGVCPLIAPSNLTVAFWCKPIAGYMGDIGQGHFCTTGYPYGNSNVAGDFNTTCFHNRDSMIDYCSSDGVHGTVQIGFTKNEWHHFAITYNGQDIKIYKDGIQTSIASFNERKTLKDMVGIVIGYSLAGGAYRSNNSYYSDFRLYTTTLSASDIQELYEMGVSG